MCNRVIAIIITLSIVVCIVCPPLFSLSVLVYVQEYHMFNEYRIAIEDGAMETFFDNGYFVINTLPQQAPLETNELQYNIWLRSLADDIEADHILLIQFNTAIDSTIFTIAADYSFIEIARPGALFEGTLFEKNDNVQKQAGLRNSSKILGQRIAQEILIDWK